MMKTQDYYNHTFFTKWAWLYDYEKYVTFPLRKKAAGLLNSYLNPSKKILDVATGTGLYACECAKLGHEVIGVDLSKAMLKQADKKSSPDLKLQFRQVNTTKLPFRDNAFDASTIFWGLHDMPYDVRLLVLKEMKRVTKSNGFLFFADYVEPARSFFNYVVYRIERIWETPMFEDFAQRGLSSHLSTVQLKPMQQITYLNFIQIVLCKNSKFHT